MIDAILAKSDLTTISEKRIRKQMQAELGRDITDQKAGVRGLYLREG
jgi:upstream activation factor subunit UAF30